MDVLPAQVVPPGGFVVVAASDAATLESSDITIVVVTDGRLGNGLANSGDRLALSAPSGEVIDAVPWGSDQSVVDLPSPPAGQSLSRDLASLTFSLGAPTPGVAAPSIDVSGPVQVLLIVEVFANGWQGQRDAAFEWVEIFYPNDTAIDLTGWRIADKVGSDPLAGTVLSGARVVVAGSAEAVSVDVRHVITIDDGRIGNGLANGGDAVSLIDPAGRQVDLVEFDGPPVPRPEEGRSIARVDDAWILSLTPTPGEPGVDPLLAALSEPTDALATAPSSSAPTVAVRQEGDDGGFPAWALIAIALGVPMLAVGAREVWRRSPMTRDN